MDWNKGFSAKYYTGIVDPVTWKDLDITGVINGSVSYTNEGLRSAADFECTEYDRTKETWIRIWLDARQEGDSAHIPLFTGLASAPDRELDGQKETLNIQCCSVLQPCQDVLLPRGWYAPSGTKGSAIIEDLLQVTPAPVDIEGETPTLLEPIVAEENENHLTMTEKILTAIGWRMAIKGDGTILIRQMPEEAVAVFDPRFNDVIETQLTESYDWQTTPNVIRASTTLRSVIIKDTDENSILSVPSRGREIWMEESDCNLNDGESLEGYAERRLKEEQNVNRAINYTRRFNPDIMVSDIVELRYPGQDIEGDFRIISQNISLGYGAPVSEEVTL